MSFARTPRDSGLTAIAMSSRLDFFVGIAAFLFLLVSSRTLPWSWDEPNAIVRSEQLRAWIQLWVNRQPQQTAPWDRQSIQEYCQFTTVIEGHPAFYGFVIASGRLVSATWLPAKESYRFGPILLFATAVGVFFHRLRLQHGVVGASVAVVGLLSMPRLFAHAQFASFDGPLTACWMLSWATFDWARRSNLGCLAWGMLLGLTMSCKFTGWLAPIGFLSWSLPYRDRDALRTCVVGGAIAVLTFVNLNPPLWNDPLGGFQQFFWMNTHRADIGMNISTQFFGEKYDMHRALPWYSSLAWVVLTVPVGTLLLSIFGIIKTVRRWQTETAGMSLLLHAAVLIVVKASPFAPPHDAERLFLPCFPFLAGLAGVGGIGLLEAIPLGATARLILTRIGICLTLISGVAEMAWYSPQWLSYYSPAVGGVSGAARLGLEPTYYWDALDQEVWEWLRSQSNARAFVYLRASPELAIVMDLDANSKIGLCTDPDMCDWYVVQNRPGAWTEIDRILVRSGSALFVKTIRHPSTGFGPWRLDVPLVYVFSHDQYLQAEQSVSNRQE